MNGILWVGVEAPWQMTPKAEIVAWAMVRPEAWADVRSSVSCYARRRCGTCDACTLRASAFASQGAEDGPHAPPVSLGGDPERERGS
jgi:7-cyano-7-deazaguanine synthase in queuosine biosynthesis